MVFHIHFSLHDFLFLEPYLLKEVLLQVFDMDLCLVDWVFTLSFLSLFEWVGQAAIVEVKVHAFQLLRGMDFGAARVMSVLAVVTGQLVSDDKWG